MYTLVYTGICHLIHSLLLSNMKAIIELRQVVTWVYTV